ncbi:MAG: two-component system sensor histidine kinase CreC [Arenicella sp.]
MKNLNVSFSLRAFIIYFVILGSLSWYIVNNAIERLNDGMRQSAESVMVDMSHLLASEVEKQLTSNAVDDKRIDTSSVKQLFSRMKAREIEATIYKITKKTIESDIYITDQNGIVLYDSTGKSLGKDYSQWRDVRLTLEGQYGARTSFIDQTKTSDDDEKIMVVAAPIHANAEIIGVLSVVKSIKSLEGHLQTESKQLKNYALFLVMLAIAIGYLFSIWLTKSLEKISAYAQNLAQGRKTEQPQFWDNRLDKLSSSVTKMRNQLDGKEYVEDYIHSLTHELKTPITSIRGASELLLEDIPEKEQQRFIRNIHSSNHRMAQLVDKMLSLAKLESQTKLLDIVEFDANDALSRLLEERQAHVTNKKIHLIIPNQPYHVSGDRLLIRQAIANLIDNALAFCPPENKIIIAFGTSNTTDFSIDVFNQGDNIPDFALTRLYERFFSLPSSHKQASTLTAKGTGLGLSFVYEIMKLHQGTIEVKNHQLDQETQGVMAQLTWSKPDMS